VIELDVVHDEQLWQVVNELRALVEKGGVVLVAFDHEIFRVIEAGALSQIGRNPADHITWFEPGRFQDPGQQRGRDCFSVRPSDDQIFAAAQEKLLQHFRRRQVIQPAVQDLLHFRISACDGVADDHDVGICRNIYRAITFIERDVSPADLFQRPIVGEPLAGGSFLRLLEQTCARTGWEVHAYCLVNNHFHLILERPPEPGCGNEMVAGNLHHTL